MSEEPPIVLVKWADARHYGGWHSGTSFEPAPCQTVGWMIERTDDHIVIAQMYNPENEVYADVAVIPISMQSQVIRLGQESPIEYKKFMEERGY